jgi:hypothetical protein
MLNELVRNSSADSRYPVSIGHDAAAFLIDDRPAAGTLTNLRINDAGVLLGDVDLQPEADKDFDAGLYPGWSVGMIPSVKNGFMFDHVALLGSAGAAFKDLREVADSKFSVIEQSEGSAYLHFEQEKKSLLMFSTFASAAVDEPSEIEERNDEMKTDEVEKMKEDHAAEIERFRARTEALETEAKERAEKDEARRREEFKSVKDSVLLSAKKKGVTETARKELEEALDGVSDLFASGAIGVRVFGAFSAALDELKPKVEPGTKTSEPGDDEIEIHGDDGDVKFTSKEATNMLFGVAE